MHHHRQIHPRVLITTAKTDSFGAIVFLGAILTGCFGGYLLAKAISLFV